MTAHFLRALAGPLLLASALSAYAQTSPETPPDRFGETLPTLLDWAEQHSPQLQAARYEHEARRQQIVSAGALEDPMVAIEWENIDKNKLTLDPRKVGGMKYSLTQPLPLWGKQALRAQVARAGAESAALMADGTRNQLHADVRDAYATWYRAAASLRLNRQQRDLLQLMEISANQRYAVGRATQAEALRVQTEISMLDNDALALQLAAAQARANLAALLNLAPEALTGTPQALDEAGLPEASQDWLDVARMRNPELLAARQAAQAAQGQLDLARRNKLPGLNLTVSAYQMGSQITSYGLMLEFQLPLQQGARNAEQAEALAMQRRARAAEAAQLRQLEREINQMRAMLDNADRQIVLFDRTVLPQAELTLQSALAGYSAGKGEFAALLEAQQQVKRLRQMRLMAEVDRFAALNALNRLVGAQQ
ncbi:TolC family protein [Chitiniphilus purpureus]|uniref:TolC family protein n=1 Tax=Chitiniphilus purpureus TaxID=2981137 RepID=A0ABY6DHT6_9NEIS|nr:TolC family protein [Chitiniphilus sp. CD1]UXY13887.1 TolC family protein [Chitiniphilus sp. CD1]